MLFGLPGPRDAGSIERLWTEVHVYQWSVATPRRVTAARQPPAPWSRSDRRWWTWTSAPRVMQADDSHGSPGRDCRCGACRAIRYPLRWTLSRSQGRIASALSRDGG